MPAPIITAVRNTPVDGLNLAVTLPAPPTGTPTFYANQLKGLAGIGQGAVIAQSGAGTAWTVQVVAAAAQIRQGWYVAVHDNNGYSNEEAEWLCFGTNLDIPNQIEGNLVDLIADNRQLVHRSLQIYEGGTALPDGSPAQLLKVVRGLPAVNTENVYPVCSVRVHTLEEDLALTSYTDVAPITGTIAVHFFHQNRGRAAEPLVRALGQGIWSVINQRINLPLPLDSGPVVKPSFLSDFETMEQETEDRSAWETTAVMTWSGELYLGK